MGALTYDVISYSWLFKNADDDTRQEISEMLTRFECARSPHLEHFARAEIARYERHGNSRSYLLLTELSAGHLEIAGFFAVGISTLDLSKTSRSQRKKFSGDFSQTESVGAYSIAQLARSDKFTSAEIPGTTILREATTVITRARSHVAGRFAVVDAQPKIVDELYSEVGFRVVHGAKAPRGMEDREFVTAACVIRDW